VGDVLAELPGNRDEKHTYNSESKRQLLEAVATRFGRDAKKGKGRPDLGAAFATAFTTLEIDVRVFQMRCSVSYYLCSRQCQQVVVAWAGVLITLMLTPRLLAQQSDEFRDQSRAWELPSAREGECFYSCSTFQAYRTTTELWLFLDVDRVTVNQRRDKPAHLASGPPAYYEQWQFRTYVLNQGGLVWKSVFPGSSPQMYRRARLAVNDGVWARPGVMGAGSRPPPGTSKYDVREFPWISAREHETVFFRSAEGHTYAYVILSQLMFKWTERDERNASFELVSKDDSAERTPLGNFVARPNAEVIKASRTNGFSRLATHNDCLNRNYHIEDSELGLRVTFVAGPFGRGGHSVIAEGLKSPAWKRILVEFSKGK